LKGLPTVRGMGLQGWLKHKIIVMLDEVTKNSLIIFGLNGWFQFRVAALSVFLVQTPAYAFLIYVACSSDSGIETSGIGFM